MQNQQDRIDTATRNAESRGPVRAVEESGRAIIVGITSEGSVPLIEDFEPLLKPSGWRERVGFVPGVREIALADMRQYLQTRASEGVVVRLEVRQGLVLAEEFFPLWACQRLGNAIEIVETSRDGSEAPAGS
jgi:hypothetical protein